VRCPHCHHPKTEVVDSRSSGDTEIRRRRKCLQCGYRFTTHERVSHKLPLVVKKDGRRQPFDREKIVEGLRLACRKRPVSADLLEEAADRIVSRVLETGTAEVAATDVGGMVLKELQNLDLVGYLRFASVYLNVQSPDEFIELLRPWVGDPTVRLQ